MTPNYEAPIPFLPAALSTRLTERGVAAPPIIIWSEANAISAYIVAKSNEHYAGGVALNRPISLVAPCLKLARCHFLAAVNLTFRRFYDTPNRYDSFDRRRM
jgi:hypothetical protein